MPHSTAGNCYELYVHNSSRCGAGPGRPVTLWVCVTHEELGKSLSRKETATKPAAFHFSTRDYPYPYQETSPPSDPEETLSYYSGMSQKEEKGLYYPSTEAHLFPDPQQLCKTSLSKTVKALCSNVWKGQTHGDYLPTHMCIQCSE